MSWRLASSVLTYGVMAHFGLPYWFVATILRVTVKWIESGMVGSFLSALFTS